MTLFLSFAHGFLADLFCQLSHLVTGLMVSLLFGILKAYKEDRD